MKRKAKKKHLTDDQIELLWVYHRLDDASNNDERRAAISDVREKIHFYLKESGVME